MEPRALLQIPIRPTRDAAKRALHDHAHVCAAPDARHARHAGYAGYAGHAGYARHAEHARHAEPDV